MGWIYHQALLYGYLVCHCCFALGKKSIFLVKKIDISYRYLWIFGFGKSHQVIEDVRVLTAADTPLHGSPHAVTAAVGKMVNFPQSIIRHVHKEEVAKLILYYIFIFS